jgi:pimeloyl-ACP methyl ester carboxylesterase
LRLISRGFEIDYEVAGDGDSVIVFIPGQLQAGEDFIDAGYTRALGSTYRVVTIDPLGYGKSDKPHTEDFYHLDGRAADVREVLNAVGADRAVLWAYSMGVISAEAFAKEFPEMVEALVLGGMPVGFDARARDNVFSPAAILLESEGLAGYIRETMPFLAESTRQLFLERNDPTAVAASSRACRFSYAAEDAPLPKMTFNYAGEAESWFDIAVAIADSKGIAFEGVPGADHGRAFRDIETVIPMVLSFLASRANTA